MRVRLHVPKVRSHRSSQIMLNQEYQKKRKKDKHGQGLYCFAQILIPVNRCTNGTSMSITNAIISSTIHMICTYKYARALQRSYERKPVIPSKKTTTTMDRSADDGVFGLVG